MPTIQSPSVQSLYIVPSFGDTTLATGTGIVCQGASGPVLVTNRHNVTGRHQDTGEPLSSTGGIPDALRVLHNKEGCLGEWVWKREPLFVGDCRRWVEHPLLGAKADIVALPLSDLDGVGLYPYAPMAGPAISFGPAETVSVVGFPFGLSAGGSLAVWATGFVASEPEFDFDGRPVFLIDCRSRPGQSGSAVVAHRNGMVALEDGSAGVFDGPVTRFLGVYSGRVNEQSDLGLVWKARAVAELVASA